MAQDMVLTDTDDLGTADHIIIVTLNSSPSLTKATLTTNVLAIVLLEVRGAFKNVLADFFC